MPVTNKTPPGYNPQPPLEPGQARRWLVAKPGESRAEATQRARQTMPWGKHVVRPPTICRSMWTFTVRTT